MSQPGGNAIPFGRKQSSTVNGHDHAMWDAAYVLGSLSSAERREFEVHMDNCESCRQAVAEISGMPALLSRLDSDDVVAIDERGQPKNAPPPMRPELWTSLLTKVTWRRRRSRLAAWSTAAAAAAVLVVGIFVALQSNPGIPTPVPPAQASSAGVAMTRVTPTSMSATVNLDPHEWGTQIQMTCTYGVWPETADGKDDDEAGDKLAMMVVGRDGSETQLATWVALTGVTAQPSGSISMPIEQIAVVQVVSVDNGNILLQHTL
jgi:Putative zinc-finger